MGSDTQSSTDRYRALGAARIEAIRQVQSPEDYQRLWAKPAHGYPFEWGTCWKQCTQYCVEDFEAEVGFFIDVVGLPTNAFGPDYAMFTSPDKAFYLGIVPANEENLVTPPRSINLGFMIHDVAQVAAQLEERGVAFTCKPKAWAEGSPLMQASFETPNGIEVTLWSMPAGDE